MILRIQPSHLVPLGMLLLGATACTIGRDPVDSSGGALTAVGTGVTDSAGTGTGGSEADDTGSADGVKLDVGGGATDLAGGTGGPVTTCEEAVAQNSYTGCEFWATVTYNYVWEDHFKFAVTVANASDDPANVEIHRAGMLVESATVEAGELAVLELPWVAELKGSQFGSQTEFTYDAVNVEVPDGAYHVTSDRPVTAYQFNALRFENTPTPPDCPAVLAPGHCYSYSNDASLLLPVSALTGNYMVTGWKNDTYSDFMSITATEDGTSVSIIPSTDSDNVDWVNALTKGQESVITLDAGDVAAFVSSYNVGEDFSGTFVNADKPIQLVSGVPCVNIPDTGVYACDHIEESVLPVEALGDDYLLTPPVAPTLDIHTVRIHGIEDGTQLQFDPASVHAPATIDQGEVLELPGVTAAFRVSSTVASFGVTNYLHGEAQAGAGDPSQAIGVPTAQFRSRYVFLAPTDYNLNYVNITAPLDSTITLDGGEVPAASFSAIGASGFGTARVILEDTGAHQIEGDQPFGILVYGYGITTSYMYPGGLGLDPITPPPIPPQG